MVTKNRYTRPSFLTRIRENLTNNLAAFLFGIFLVLCSIVLFFFHNLKQTALIIIAILGILFVIGSLLKPRRSDGECKKSDIASRSENQKHKNVLAQYHEIQENQRSTVRLIWEIPTIAIAISTAFLVASYNYFPDNNSINHLLVRSMLLFFGSLLMFIAFLEVIKHRHFRGVWLEYLKRIEKCELGLEPIPMWTEDTKKTRVYKKTNFFHKFFLPRSSEIWLANALFLILIAFMLLLIYNLYFLKLIVMP